MRALTEIVLENIQPTFNLSLIMATVWIINNDFAKFSISSLTIGQYAINRNNRLYHNDLINEIFKEAMKQPAIKFYIEGEESGIVEEQDLEDDEDELDIQPTSRHKVIFFLDSMVSYINFEQDLLNPKNHYHRSGIFLLIYTGIEPQRLSNIREIFRRLFALYVTNINVMLIVGRSPYLYTFFPFAKNKCHSSLPEYYLSFRDIEKNYDSYVVNKHVYPNKVKNMYGCELVVATWTAPPYVYVEHDEETNELLLLHGIEGLLISLLAELMNFKILIKAPDPLDRGDVYPNGTATGATKMIVDAEANITIMSFMYNKLRSEAMQASYSYAAIPYVLAIPNGHTLSPLERMIRPFGPYTWSCFSFSLIISIIFIYYVRFVGNSKLMDFIFGHGNRIPFSNLLSTLFGGAALNPLSYRVFARYLFIMWMFYTFILRSAYSGALFNMLQDIRTHTSLSGIQEVVDQNYTFYAYPATVRFLKGLIPGVSTGTLSETNPTIDILERISLGKEKLALAILEYSVKLYNQLNPTRRVDILDEPLFTSQVVFFMPRHTYMIHHTDYLISQILATGLMKRFESFYLYTTNQHRYDQREPNKLSLSLLCGLFIVYTLFLFVSLIVFFVELSSLKSSWCKIIMDFLNF